MGPKWLFTQSISAQEPVQVIASQLEELEETNRCLRQDLLQQQAEIRQLIQSSRELEMRHLEIATSRDQALLELEERYIVESTFRQQTEALRRSNRDLEQFASLAAHDLQEPLHSIQVFSDLLRVRHGAALSEQGLGYLGRVTRAAARMQQLIEGLLIYSRMDAPVLKADALPLQEVVQDILADLHAHIEELHADIHVGELPVIRGNALHIRQLLQNLIGNALKFGKPGMVPTIHVTATMIQDRRHVGAGQPGCLWQIEVQDQGIGIPAQHLDKIFGMFTRLHRKDEYEGTGIGLAVCQRIVDQCGGALSVRSIVGKGSIFTVTLPV